MPRVVHFEILADDPERAARFYEAVLGWETESPEGMERYWLITTGPDRVPGINGGMMDRHFAQGVINTAEVASLSEALDKVTANGGALVHGPNEIPGIGTHAYCTDTEGSMFGMIEPAVLSS